MVKKMTIKKIWHEISKKVFQKIIVLFAKIFNKQKSIFSSDKVTIITDGNNWVKINYAAVVAKLICSGIAVDYNPFVPQNTHETFSVDENFRNVEYKGVNLYCVSEYDICVALEVFPSKVFYENPEHRAVIAEWFSRSAECIDFFLEIIEQKKPGKFLISQGHNYDAAIIRALSCLHCFNVVAIENTFNKNKLVWDDVSGITVNKNLAKNYFWKYSDTVAESVAASYIREYLTGIKQVKSTQHQTPLATIPTSDKKTILFVGQVYSDASVLFGINDFACPEDIIESLVDYCLGNNYHLIIKLHPKEAAGIDILGQPYNNLTYRKLTQRGDLLVKIMDNDFILDKGTYDTYALIDVADVCVTINSQAGLEALIKGKNLIVCGQSFYSGLGFTFDALNKVGLVCALDQVIKQGISILDIPAVNKFFYITSEKYFMDRTEKSIQLLLGHRRYL